MSDLAERYFERALTAIKGHANAHALALLVEAIKLKPEFTEAWVVRGNVLHSMDDHFNALLHYDRALSFNDNLHDAWNNRGLAFGDLGMWQAAEMSFRKSLELCPAVEPHIGLANMFCTLNRLEEAAKEYRACITIDQGFLDARFNLGVTLLGLGQWTEGFKEYEYRWQNTPMPPRAYRNYPKWKGEDLHRKRILLYPEQGYGDEIMGLRFAETVANAFDNAYVIVQARTPMLLLAKTMAQEGRSAIRVVPYSSDHAWRADYSCPLLDVPITIGPRIVDPGKGETWIDGWAGVRSEPYLRAPSYPMESPSVWFDRVEKLPDGLNVGLCWSSGGHLNTARASQQTKSIPLHWLKGLALPGVNLISLQKDNREPIPDGLPIIDWTADIHDFADTAALIEELDLVISVDTSVAHLAGALGKPVWNFVRFSGYWPWLAPQIATDPEHAIWYPSMKLLRQPQLGNWAEPIERATNYLRAELQKAAA